MSQSLSSKQYSHAARSWKEALISALVLDNVKETKTLKRPSSESSRYQNHASSIQVKYLFFCMVRYKEFRVRYPATYFSDYKNMLALSVFIWACEYYVVHETVLEKPTPFNSAWMVKLSNRSKTGPLIPNSSLFQWSPPQSKMDSVSDSETS